MAETSKGKDVKSPQEIEEGIKSIATLTWDPFTVFPKEIYLKIFNMLESAEDKRNFMNAHMKWHDLFKLNRVLFLFGSVFKEVFINDDDEEEDKYDDEEDEDLSLNSDASDNEEDTKLAKYLRCRLVCHDWDNGIQRYFQLHESYFTLDDGEKTWPPWPYFQLLEYPYKSEEEAQPPCHTLTLFCSMQVDEKLEAFRVTHSKSSKNPIFSRSITLRPFGFGPDYEHGLEVIRGFRRAVDVFLEKYGRHIWHCKIEIEEKLNPEACICIGKWISLMPELKTLQLKYQEEYAIIHSKPLSKTDLKEIEDAEIIQSEMKNLVFLKWSYLPSVLFNKLVGRLPKLEMIQIKIYKIEQSFLRHFELKIERENLKEAFFTLKGIDDFNYLENCEPFPNLEKLVLTLEFGTDEERSNKAYSRWPKWKMIFKILEEKFPAVEELSLRLPKAVSEEDKMVALNQSMKSQLNLPKLEKLWVALPNLSSLGFLLPCKKLMELEVIIEHCDWDMKGSKVVRKRGREKINFNMDLKKMWESNIWEVFPELWLLKIQAWRQFEWFVSSPSDFDRYIYGKVGEERKYYESIIDKRDSNGERRRSAPSLDY